MSDTFEADLILKLQDENRKLSRSNYHAQNELNSLRKSLIDSCDYNFQELKSDRKMYFAGGVFIGACCGIVIGVLARLL